MKLKGRLTEFDFDFHEGRHFIHVVIDSGNLDEVNKYIGKDLIVEIREPEKLATKNQNAYFWAICSQIGNHKDIMKSKDEIYRKLLFDYGETVGTLATDKQTDAAQGDIHFFLTKKGRKYNHYIMKKGLSYMSRQEKTTFIQHAIEEAKDLGIDTTPPYEWERLIKLWNQS